MRDGKSIELNAQNDRALRALSQRKRIGVRLQHRATIVLFAAKALHTKDSAIEVEQYRQQVEL